MEKRIKKPQDRISLNSVRASLVVQMVKNLPAMQETWVWSLTQKNPLEKRMAPHGSILAWRIPWAEEAGRLQSIRLQRVRHNWATNTFSLHFWRVEDALWPEPSLGEGKLPCIWHIHSSGITRHPLKVWIIGTEIVLSKLCGLEVGKWDEMKYSLSWWDFKRAKILFIQPRGNLVCW